jgi:chromosome segregation ATPase
MYPPTGGKEGDIGSTTGGTLANEIARHNEQVDTAGQRGKAGRKKRAEEANPDSLDMQILKDELAAAEKGTERSETELKKARGLLEERTAEVKSMKQSMTANNRARSEGERELHILQKQVDQASSRRDLETLFLEQSLILFLYQL